MPSHIAHALLAEDLLVAPDRPDIPTPDDTSRRLLVLGSQGPDIFLHNHRRTPRGFRYGALLHRKGNDLLLAHVAARIATLRSRVHRERALALAFGYIGHVWLDRFVHPYINYHAGWRGVPDRDAQRPAMHAFLERLIDVQLLDHLRGCSVRDYDFYRRLPRSWSNGSLPPASIAAAIRAALVSANTDARLHTRLGNALCDALDYYRSTSRLDADYFHRARRAELRGAVGFRWLAVVHPPADLIPFDSLNTEHRRWYHPCDRRIASNDSVLDLYRAARERSIRSCRVFHTAVVTGRFADVAVDIGPHNLNDGISSDPPCRKRIAEPLPVLELYRRIKHHYS